jgi:hypothetical protein
MVIDASLTSHEYLKSSNFEVFLYMSVNYKRKHRWTKKHQKRGKEEYVRSPILIYMIYYK